MSPVFAIRRLFQVGSRLFLALSLLALFSFPAFAQKDAGAIAEFFKILNHTNFLFARSGPQNGTGSTIRGASQYGFLTAARDPRQIQVALKLSF